MLQLAALLACAWLSLRPDARVERWLDVALVPTRVLAEVCAPFGWLRAPSVRAAERALGEREGLEVAERERLHRAERQAALPSRAELGSGRRFVHAEVVGRRAGRHDELQIRLDGDRCDGLSRGMPVTSGDAFVGRILELDVPAPGFATVELVTSPRFGVGARVEAGGAAPILAVAGGVAPGSRARGGRLHLALASPSRGELAPGPVVIDESLSDLARFAEQSNGFDLGLLRALGPGEWGIEPRVDYRSGLFQVVVAAPERIARPAEDAPRDELLDGRWQRVRATSCGETGVAREGLEIGAGRWTGARDGAALVFGARLVGRVAHAGALSSDARWLGDAGFAIHALARVEGREAPLALGRLVSLGRPRDARNDDELELAWEAVVPIAAASGERSVAAQLFTGSGDELVPRGLLLGEADLPTGAGPHRVRLRQSVDTRALRHLWMRLPDEVAP
jgi:hypothetical protein